MTSGFPTHPCPSRRARLHSFQRQLRPVVFGKVLLSTKVEILFPFFLPILMADGEALHVLPALSSRRVPCSVLWPGTNVNSELAEGAASAK